MTFDQTSVQSKGESEPEHEQMEESVEASAEQGEGSEGTSEAGDPLTTDTETSTSLGGLVMQDL